MSNRNYSKLPMSYIDNASNGYYDNNLQGSQSLNMNNINVQSNIFKSSGSNFPFKASGQKFKWKELMKLNPNYMQSSRDMSSLEPYVENLLYSTIDESELQMLPEGYVMNVIKLLQLIGMNLANIQERLENDNKELEDKTMRMSQQQQLYKGSAGGKGLQTHLSMIKLLKQQNKEKDLLISTYQKLIQNDKGVMSANIQPGAGAGPSGGGLIDDDDEGYNGQPARFYCQYCSGKKFSSETYLEDHMRRRHLITSQAPNSNRNNDVNIDMKLNEMKSHFDTIMRNSQMQNEYQRLNDKISNLENTINGGNVEMMTNLQMSMNDMKSRYGYQSQVVPQQKNIIQPLRDTLTKTIYLNDNANANANSNNGMLKDTMMRINERLERNNKDNNDKLQDLIDEMKKMKMSVSNDISNIKQNQSFQRSNNRAQSSHSNNYRMNNPNSQGITVSKGRDLSVPHQTEENQKKTTLENMEKRKPQEKKMYTNTPITPQPEPQSQSQPKEQVKQSPPIQQQNTSNISIVNSNKESIVKVTNKYIQNASDPKLQLDLFYKKFHERDNEISNGDVKDYLIRLIPQDEASRNRSTAKIESLINNKIFQMANNQKVQLNNLSKDDLMQLINNCCQDLNEKAVEIDNQPSFYSYYKTNLDYALEIEKTVETSNNIYLESKDNEKRKAYNNYQIQSQIQKSQMMSQIQSQIQMSQMQNDKEKEKGNHGIRLEVDEQQQVNSPKFQAPVSGRFNQQDRSFNQDRSRLHTASEANYLGDEFDRNN